MSQQLIICPPLPELLDTWMTDRFVLYTQLFRHYPWEVFTPLRKRYEEALPRYVHPPGRGKQQVEQDTDSGLWLELAGLAPAQESESHPPERHGPGGRPAAPFDALLKAFLGARLQRSEDTAQAVWELLHFNPLFCLACGFSHPPSYRVVARFDQIMTQEGIWDTFWQLAAKHNLVTGAAHLPDTLAIDTTHVEADAALGKKKKDSEEPTDDNVGLVRKSRTVTYVGHKIALLTDPQQQLPWAVLAFPGGYDDGHTLEPTLNQYAANFLEGLPRLKWVLADGIYNTKDNYHCVVHLRQDEDGKPIYLITPIHPRNRKDHPVNDSGITHIDRYGVPHCIANEKLLYLGRERPREYFVWVCPHLHPDLGDGKPCPLQYKCCPGAYGGRVYRVPRHETPQVNWDYPQHGERHRQLYRQRTNVERVIGWLKDRLGMRRVHRRGRAAAQGLAAQCAGLMHIVHFLRYTGILPLPKSA